MGTIWAPTAPVTSFASGAPSRIYAIVRSFSPHPALSLGEREQLSAAWEYSLNSEHFPALPMVPPLPKGEGWGEGEGDG